MDLLNHQFHAVTVLCLLALGFGAVLILLLAETRNIHRATRALLRTERAPSGFSLIFPEMKALWRCILTLQSNIRSLESAGQTETEALELSSSISSAAHDFNSVTEEAVAAVIRQASPEIVACAILFRSTENDQFSVQSCRGIPIVRVEDALTTYLESICENSQECDWGYLNPDRNSLLDFSTFSIATQLLIPLYIGAKIQGALWLGLKKGAAGLNSKRIERLRAFSLHVVGSIEAAFQSASKLSVREERFRSIVEMSHDMRAPGNTAIYALHGLLEVGSQNLNTEQRETLSIVKEGIEDQLGLIDDILDFARSESKQLRARITAHPIKGLLERITANCQHLTKSKGLKFNLSTIPEAMVVVDDNHFKRIISNLLSNAIKYTEQGSISIEVELTNSRLNVAVLDTGIGIPEDEQRNVFEEFYRASNGDTQQGVGLGLALTKRLAELNEAKVSYRPRKGGGSIFSVSFRAIAATDLKPTSCSKLRPQVQTILLVEDDQAVSRTISRQLQGLAQEFITAACFKEARDILNNITPTVLISDFNLGDGTAINVIEELQRRKMEVPTIILTGSSYTLDIDNLLKFGTPIEVIQKPISREELREKVLQLAENEPAAYHQLQRFA